MVFCTIIELDFWKFTFQAIIADLTSLLYFISDYLYFYKKNFYQIYDEWGLLYKCMNSIFKFT